MRLYYMLIQTILKGNIINPKLKKCGRKDLGDVLYLSNGVGLSKIALVHYDQQI